MGQSIATLELATEFVIIGLPTRHPNEHVVNDPVATLLRMRATLLGLRSANSDRNRGWMLGLFL